MLLAGTIQPSNSLYSSPVVLVKIKDGSWRMCVNNRALDSQTIKDKYLIPLIEDLLDELHGEEVFTKIDLRSGIPLDSHVYGGCVEDRFQNP